MKTTKLSKKRYKSQRPNHIYGSKTLNKKNTYFENYDIYFNPNPKDTIRIKYATLKDVKFTIKKLESLFKRKLRPHVRISKVANVLCQRLRVLYDKDRNNTELKNRYKLSQDYFEFLKKRTKHKGFEKRRSLIFYFN